MTTTASNGASQANGEAVRSRKPLNSNGLGGKSRSTNSLAASGTVGTPQVLAAKDIAAIYDRCNAKKADGKPVHSSPYLALIKECMSLQCTDKLSPEILNLCRQAAGKAVVQTAVDALSQGVNIRIKSAAKFSSVGVTRLGNEIYKTVTAVIDQPCKTEAEERECIADIQTGFQSRAGRASDLVAIAHAANKLDYAKRIEVQDAVASLLKEHRKFADYCQVLGKPVEQLIFHGHITDIILPNVQRLLA